MLRLRRATDFCGEIAELTTFRLSRRLFAQGDECDHRHRSFFLAADNRRAVEAGSHQTADGEGPRPLQKRRRALKVGCLAGASRDVQHRTGLGVASRSTRPEAHLAINQSDVDHILARAR